MTDTLCDQIGELTKETRESLAKINMLIENRGAWKDGIEGCRESALVLSYILDRLKALEGSAQAQETALTSARAELERWSKMHAELSTVERDLRAECEQHRAALDEKSAILGRARLLTREFTKELTKALGSQN